MSMDLTLDIGIFPCERVPLVFVEAIQREIEFAMDARAWVLEAMRLFVGGFVNTEAWIRPQVLSMDAPQVVNCNLGQFGNPPNILQNSPCKRPELLLDRNNSFDPSEENSFTVAVRIIQVD